MIEKKDMQNGLVIWWTATRGKNTWSTPGIVVEMDENYFKILRFDKFTTSDIYGLERRSLTKPCIYETELRAASIEEVTEYMLKKMKKLKNISIDASKGFSFYSTNAVSIMNRFLMLHSCLMYKEKNSQHTPLA